MELVGRLLGLLALLLAGTALRAGNVLDRTRSERLNAFAYWVALPALIFVSTYDQSMLAVVTPALVGGHVFVLLSTAGLAWAFFRQRGERDRQSVAVVQSYHSNIGYLGFPLIAATFEAGVTAVAGVILGVVSLVQVPLTVGVFVSVNQADVPFRREVAKLAANPVLLSLVAGVVVSVSSVGVPPGIAGGLDALGSLALPTALLCVGASLDVEVPSFDAWATGMVVVLKVVFMPALAWVVFRALAADAATVTASVVMLGTPTAVSTFVFAGELGGDTEFASLNVFASTVASIVTLFSLVALFG